MFLLRFSRISQLDHRIDTSQKASKFDRVSPDRSDRTNSDNPT